MKEDKYMHLAKKSLFMKTLYITFVTASSIEMGSTRIRVHKIADALKNRGYKVYINTNFEKADILVFQKSDYSYLKKYFNKYLYSNKLLIYDVDDLYLGKYLEFVYMSDFVITGSKYLKDYFYKYNKNIIDLENTIDVKEYDTKLPKYNLKTPKIGWFGSRTNIPVLETFGLNNITKITLGGDIEWSLDSIDSNIQSFDLIIIPQTKTPYGLSKSNCRMLKTLYLGVPALVTDIEPYLELAQFLNYPKDFIVTDKDNWLDKIAKIKSDDMKFEFDFKFCRQKIMKKYCIANIVEQWIAIVENALKVQKTPIQRLYKFYKYKSYNEANINNKLI